MLKAKFPEIKASSRLLSQLNLEKRHQVLAALSQSLNDQQDKILAENAKDLKAMSKQDPNYDRLLLTPDRIKSMADEILKVIELPDPLNHILYETTRPNGLKIKKVSVPLGVVGVIYESRPNVTVDVFTLCFKSGNACILKGGKEAIHTNMALLALIHRALTEHQIANDIVTLLGTQREDVYDLLHGVGMIDVLIPRGSQELIQFVRDNAKVPVIETGAGIVHTYFDLSGDLIKGKSIIFNAKTRRVSVCNSLDTLIIHHGRLNDLPELVIDLAKKNVEIYADLPSYDMLKTAYPANLLKQATIENYGKEFLDYKMAIKTVYSIDEAIDHISLYSSGHSEAIIADDINDIHYFLNHVDAAAVYANASTAFSDGGEFGMGAEIGISTQKLHARGPMGLQALTSYKWLVYGNGQVR